MALRLEGRELLELTTPAAALGRLPLEGGNASGPAKPVPRRSLD
jgi:hypothetical protein